MKSVKIMFIIILFANLMVVDLDASCNTQHDCNRIFEGGKPIDRSKQDVFCINKTCQLKDIGYCDANNPCQQGKCINNLCKCESDSDCDPFFSRSDFHPFVCVNKKCVFNIH